jgi:hypothetical protein
MQFFKKSQPVVFVIACFLESYRCWAIRTRLTWINGIGHTLAHMEEGQAFISAKFGGKPVEWCHNPTAMLHDEDWKGYLGDLTQAGTHKMGKITAEVETLIQHLQRLIQAVGKRGVVLHIAHSQGALITALACKHLTPQQMSQMEVVCFGGAAGLRKNAATPFRRCMNYYSVNDPLLLLNPEALQALRSGFLNEEFCFLSPRLGDPILDHSLINPTYAEALGWEGLRYQQLYLSTVYRVWIRLRRMLLALYTLLHQKCIAVVMEMIQPFFDRFHKAIVDRVAKPLAFIMLLFVDWIRNILHKNADFIPLSDFAKDLIPSADRKINVSNVHAVFDKQIN